MDDKNKILIEKNLEAKKGFSHAKCHLRYHIIFVTKYRRKCLEPIKDIVFEGFRICESKSHFKIHNMNIDKDHIHLLIEIHPKYSISQTVERMKQMTLNHVYRECNDYMRHFYWTKKRRLWTSGYFVSTVGKVSEDIVFNYINNQGIEYYK